MAFAGYIPKVCIAVIRIVIFVHYSMDFLTIFHNEGNVIAHCIWTCIISSSSVSVDPTNTNAFDMDTLDVFNTLQTEQASINSDNIYLTSNESSCVLLCDKMVPQPLALSVDTNSLNNHNHRDDPFASLILPPELHYDEWRESVSLGVSNSNNNKNNNSCNSDTFDITYESESGIESAIETNENEVVRWQDDNTTKMLYTSAPPLCSHSI